MFIRKKRNQSGSISVQVLRKEGRRNILLKTIGSSSDPSVIMDLERQARDFVELQQSQFKLQLGEEAIEKWFDAAFSQIGRLTSVGAERILAPIYEQIGFTKIEDPLFRDLVMARLTNPSSKLKTLRLLESTKGRTYSIKSVYRYMDKLHSEQKQLVEQISYEHTLAHVLGSAPSMLFYDVTTIYFEAEKEDELRIAGFSKEGRHKHPQILLGLLVSFGGHPMAYEIFEGNKYEGHTMMPVIRAFKKRFSLGKIVVVADSGLLNRANLEEIVANKDEFILGARLKNEPKDIQEQVLKLSFQGDGPKVIQKQEGVKLVVSHSPKRAAKDQKNREKGIQRLQKAIESGKLTKSNINNRGYNKFLKMSGKVSISLDQEKIDQEHAWDGLKGYLTNIDQPTTQTIDQYNHLWQIEKAFRVSKTELRIRPIYHRLRHRIEAHICISFAAYKVYKELERRLENTEISIQRALEVIPQITAVTIKHPNGTHQQSRVIFQSENQKKTFESLEKVVGDPMS